MNRLKNRLILTLERLARRPLVRRTHSIKRGDNFFADLDLVFGNANVGIVIDGGANIGQSAQEFHAQFPNAEIHSFEPVSRTFEMLTTNTRHTSRVKPHRMGLSNQNHQREINLSSLSVTASLEGVHQPQFGTEEVILTTFDHFADTNEIKFVDLLKSDTEGHEIQVVEGARKMLNEHRIGMVYVEAELMSSDQHSSVAEIAKYLKSFGYNIFGIYEQQPYWEGNHKLRFFNVAFISERLSLSTTSRLTYPQIRSELSQKGC